MNKNLFRGLTLILLVILINGCIRGYTPDIVLKKDGQPCISIPADEDFFRRQKEFNILGLDIYQTGVGELWSRHNLDSKDHYYVKNQQCLYFNYKFQTNILYDIGFFSTEKGDEENRKSTKKVWMRYMRIIKKSDGTLQLLLDKEARDYY